MKLPKEWKIEKLGNLAEFKNGLNFSPNETGQPIKILGVGDFQDRREIRDLSLLKTIQLKSLPEDVLLKDGDLVFVRSNGSKALVGRCLAVYPRGENLTYSGFSIRARVTSKETSSIFVQTLIESGALKKSLKKRGAGTNISNLNQEILKDIPIHLPPLPEQRAIADLLSTWDSAIEKTEQLVTIKRRKIDLLLSNIYPRSVKKKELVKNIAVEVSIRNREINCQRVLSVTNHSGFVLPENQFGRRVASEDVGNYKIVKKGQYAYNPSRINVGSIARLDQWEMGILSPMYVVFELDVHVVNSDYFLHWLSSYAAKEKIKKCAQGSVRETVDFSSLGMLEIPLPSKEQQNKMALLLNSVRDEVATLERLIQKLKEQKRGLMQKLLIGSWRVTKTNGGKI